MTEPVEPATPWTRSSRNDGAYPAKSMRYTDTTNIVAAAEEPLPPQLLWGLRTSHRFEINLSHCDSWPVAM